MKLVLVAEYDVPEDDVEIRWAMHEFMRSVQAGPIDPIVCCVAIKESADEIMALFP